MALDLGNLDEFLDASTLVTLNGKQYKIPPVSAEIGLWVRRITARRGTLRTGTDDEVATAIDELGAPPLPEGVSIEEAMLGTAFAELAADGIPDDAVKRLAQIIYGRIIGGDELALAMARGDDPKAPVNRAQRRAVAKKAAKAVMSKASGSSTTSTAKAATTRKPASGSGTKSRPTPVKAAKAASRGAKS